MNFLMQIDDTTEKTKLSYFYEIYRIRHKQELLLFQYFNFL